MVTKSLYESLRDSEVGQVLPRMLRNVMPQRDGDWYDATTIEDQANTRRRFVDQISAEMAIISTRQNRDGTARLRSDGLYETIIRR